LLQHYTPHFVSAFILNLNSKVVFLAVSFVNLFVRNGWLAVDCSPGVNWLYSTGLS